MTSFTAGMVQLIFSLVINMSFLYPPLADFDTLSRIGGEGTGTDTRTVFFGHRVSANDDLGIDTGCFQGIYRVFHET